MKKLLVLLLLTSFAAAQQINYARMLSGVNYQSTVTSYTFVALDATRPVVFNSGIAVAVTLPSGLTSGFGAGKQFDAINAGAGIVTITCSGCTITALGVSGATLALNQGQGADLYSDGTNYVANVYGVATIPFTIAIPGTAAKCMAYYPNGTVATINGDCNILTDGAGNHSAKSYTTTDTTHGGFINFIDGPVPSAPPTGAGQIYYNSATFTLTKPLVFQSGFSATGAFSADLSGLTLASGFKVPILAGAAPTASGAISYDSTANNFKAGKNGSTFTVCTTANESGCASGGGGSTGVSGTATLGTSAIASGACASVVTIAATGVLTTDTVQAVFNGDPTAITGYSPATSGMLTIIAYPTANNVNFKVCNNTVSSITPGAATLNWRVGAGGLAGTAAMGTSPIASGTCATAVTVPATGVVTTNTVQASFNSDPTGVTGYTPASTGMLTIIPYPTANNVNFKVCNNTTSSITPGAITLNWRVEQ